MQARHEERQSYALASQLASDGHAEGIAAKAEMPLDRLKHGRCLLLVLLEMPTGVPFLYGDLLMMTPTKMEKPTRRSIEDHLHDQ